MHELQMYMEDRIMIRLVNESEILYTLDCVMYPELTGCYYWFRSSIADSPLTTYRVCAMFVSIGD